jgi:hypothetical protein
MNPAELFIFEKEGNQKEILEFLHHYILKYDSDIYCKLRYGIPFYYKRSWICYLNTVGRDKVEIAFTRANELKENIQFLEFGKRKQVAGITIQNIEDIPLGILKEVLAEALVLDKNVNYSVKK